MNVSHKTIASSRNNQSWVLDALQFIDQMQRQDTSVENRKFISELSRIIRSSSRDSLEVSTVEQDSFSNMSVSSPGHPSSRIPDEIIIDKNDATLTCLAFSQGPEDLSRKLFHAILSFLKTKNEAPVLALSSLKDRVSAQCLIGGVEIPLMAYAPAEAPGTKLAGTLHLHPNTFQLDQDLIKILDPRIYQLSEPVAQKYKANFVAKGLLKSDASHAEVEALNKHLFNEKILNGCNGFLTGLVMRTPSLLGHDSAIFYSLYLLTFFVLDDTTESMDSTQKAELFSRKALDILSGKQDINDLHAEEGLQHPGYYLAGQLRAMFTSVMGADPDQKLSNWYGLMADQFDSAVEEVKSKGQLDKLLPSYGTHEDERSATIGTHPCLEMIDALLDITWSRHMRRKLDLVEKKVAKAVFEFNNVISLYKELREAFVDTKVLSKSDFCAQFNAQTLICNLSEDLLLKLPLNGVLIRSYHSRISLVTAMSEGISIYDRTIQELEESLLNLSRETSSDKELEALQARFSLAVGSTRWSMKTGRYTLDKKAVSDEWWKALNKDLFPDTEALSIPK